MEIGIFHMLRRHKKLLLMESKHILWFHIRLMKQKEVL